MRNFMDLSRALKSLADAFHTIKLKLDGLYDSTGALVKKCELIETITLEEDTAEIIREYDHDAELYLYFNIEAAASAATLYFDVQNNAAWEQTVLSTSMVQTAARQSTIQVLKKWSKFFTYTTGASSATSYTGAMYETYISHSTDHCTGFRIRCNTLPAGSTIAVYEIKKG